jgi:hypothetical protein
MNKPITLDKNDYELIFIPLEKIFFKKLNERTTVNSVVRNEVERQYPFYDIQSQVFYRLAVFGKKIVLAVIIMEAGALTKYKNNKLVLQYNTLKMRVFYNRKKMYLKAFILLMLFSVVVSAMPYINKKENKSGLIIVEENGNEDKTEISVNKTIEFSVLFNLLQSIRNECSCSVESLSIVLQPEKNTALITLLLHGIFPEQIVSYFPAVQRNNFEIDQVVYNNNSPSFTLALSAAIPENVNSEDGNLIELREILLNRNGILKYEKNNSKEIMALVNKKDMKGIFDALALDPDIGTVKSLSVVLRNEFYEVTFEKGIQNISPFSSAEFCSFITGLVNTPEKNKDIKEVPKEQKRSAGIFTGPIVGKIMNDDGSFKVFYKSTDGKLISEVQK